MAETTKNLAEVLRQRLAIDPQLREQVEQECEHSHLAELIYEKRTEKGFTQKRLAELAGTTQTVIARLEAADYEAHSFTMVRRIADALDCVLRVEMYSRPVVQFSQSFSWPEPPAEPQAPMDVSWTPTISTSYCRH